MGDHPRKLPTLAPGPRAAAAPSTASTSRPKKNSTACQACKQAKRKCSGRPSPCKACEAADLECIFDETLDLRRKVAIKRTIEELEYHKDLLYSLIESLRSSEPTRVDSLLTLIRSNASLNDIAAAISENIRELHDKGTPDSNVPASLEEAVSQVNQLQRLSSESYSRRKFITLEKICDIPLYNVPAKPWTSVTDDSQFVSHLVSLYFTWNHPFLQFIDQQLFLKHMASGDLNSKFCTPFLVNSMLALASMYSGFPEAFAVPGEMSSRGQHFYAEAEKLWKAGKGKATLPNVQGVLLMVLVLTFRGEEKAGWLLLKQAVQLAQDLELFPTSSRPLSRSRHNTSAEMQPSRALTAWGIFILNSQLTIALHKVADLDLPLAPLYTGDDLNDDIMWIPYPRSNQIDYAKKPALLRYVMANLCDLTKIVVEIQDLLFDKARQMSIEDSWTAANQLYTRLQHWYENQPRILDIDNQPIPQALLLRIQYHSTIITLFEIFVGRDYYKEATRPPRSEHAQSIRLQSAREIARYCRIERQCYGLNQIPRQMLQYTCTGLFTLLRDLDNAESLQAFVEFCRFLSAFARRSQHSKVMIRTLELTAQQSGLSLPPEAVSIFDSQESGAWYDRDTQD